jgi:SAM-dependent methyltransferase
MNIQDQIRIYRNQAAWTAPMRRELYRRVRLASCKDVLDVGCGDGTITKEMAEICRGKVLGLDIDPQMIDAAKQNSSKASFAIGDACALDFEKSSFDLVSCHWLLLWLKKPEDALKEFRRVLKPGGTLLIACEPDYGGRMVFPETSSLNDEIISALQKSGAEPLMGRKIPALLAEAGFKANCGLYPGVWDSAISEPALEAKIDWLQTLLAGHVENKKLSAAFSSLRKHRKSGSLLLFTPVFWAIATAPG